MKKLFATALCALSVLCGYSQQTTGGIDYTNLDQSVRPGDDFFKYATGNWVKNHPQPPIYPMWGSFAKLADDNTNAVASMVQDIAREKHAAGSIEQKIGDLYNLSMDSVRRNREGAAPALAEVRKVQAINDRAELIRYMAHWHDDLLWGIGISADEKDASRNVVGIGQGGLSMGNRDYYTATDSATVKVREAAKQHCVNLFTLCGYSESDARARMNTLWDMESRMAQAWYSREQLRDPEANYHKMTVAELTKLCGGFDWAGYLRDYGYDQTTEVVLGQPEPIVLACKMLTEEPLENLKLMYEWQIISGASSYLSDDFINENFAFNQQLTGVAQMPERWRRSVDLVSGMLGDAVGQMFAERYFSPESKERMLEMIHNLQTVLGRRIMAQDWMSDETKKVALEKLNAYYVKVGYPDKWDDLSALVIDPAKSLYENVIAASRFYWQLNKEKKYNKPVDKTEWLMQPQMVNAYYLPTTNEICFPAGILQPPFFNPNADDAANYGAIGVVIAHEMTHGFDDQGRQYDKEGNLRQWWSDADVEAFKRPAQQMVDYFNTLWVIPGELRSNGSLCLGENIADHGGLNIAYEALQLAQEQHGKLPTENGFTPEQRFFLSFANVWASTTSPQMLQYLTMNDVHSADHLRVNGGVAQCSYWYDAFGIKPGDKLYVAPEDRVKIW